MEARPSEQAKKENLITKIKIAIRAFKRHRIDKVSIGGDSSHTRHMSTLSAAHADHQSHPIDAWARGGGSRGARVGVANIVSLTEEKERTLRETSALCVGAAAVHSNRERTPQIAQPATDPPFILHSIFIHF